MNKQIELFQLPDEEVEVPVLMIDESVWMRQAEMAQLFQTSQQNISSHINNIIREGELEATSTHKKFLYVATNGKTYNVIHYNLDMIISVGYRINSKVGTQFRIWATKRLKEYLTKGYILNEKRLIQEYSDELIERIRAIRTSEQNLHRKITDIFATSIDYDPNSSIAKNFFAQIQNKLHYAVHGQTAAEVIMKRADSQKAHMGLTHWKGKRDITKADTKVAKNYLSDIELKLLELLCEQILSFAEFRYTDQTSTTMQEWVDKIDELLRVNEREVLQGLGMVSRKQMLARVNRQLEQYRQQNNNQRVLT